MLEYGCQVWGGLLSGLQASKIEHIQILALQVILGAESSSYTTNLLKLDLPRLSVRREDLTLRFAIATLRDPKHNWWFTPTPTNDKNTRHLPDHPFKTPRFVVPSFRTARSEGMPIAVYSRALNELTDTEWKDFNLPAPNECKTHNNFQLSSLYSFELNGRNTVTDPCTATQCPAPN